MTLTKIGSKTVCGFGVFDVSPKGTEAKGASNLLALLIYKFMLSKNTDKSFIMVLTKFTIKRI
jgi:hypothetical protein